MDPKQLTSTSGSSKKMDLKQQQQPLPLSQSISVTDHGAIPRDTTTPEVQPKGRLSSQRKFCFMMSFNIWLIYFVAIFWIVPCRHYCCYSNITWELTLNDTVRTTNIAVVREDDGDSNLIVVGYSNAPKTSLQWNFGSIVAMELDFGTVAWKRTLPFVPLLLECQNGTNCTATGSDIEASFNATDGSILRYEKYSTINVTEGKMNCASNYSEIVDVNSNEEESLSQCIADSNFEVFGSGWAMRCTEFSEQLRTRFNGTRLLFHLESFINYYLDTRLKYHPKHSPYHLLRIEEHINSRSTVVTSYKLDLTTNYCRKDDDGYYDDFHIDVSYDI